MWFKTALTLNDIWFLAAGRGDDAAGDGDLGVLGTMLGVVFGVFRGRWGRGGGAAGFVLDIFRSVPLLIQLVLANAFVIAVSASGSRAFTVRLRGALALHLGLLRRDRARRHRCGAPDAAPRRRILGMTWGQDMTYIVLPLATRVALPAWIGLTLGVMKDTALVFIVQVVELLKSTQILITRLQEPLFLLMICGLFYFLISFPIARLGGYLERRWSAND